MDAAEHISRMNELLSREVPRLAPLAWIPSNDKRLFCPMALEEPDELGRMQPVMRYQPCPASPTLLIAQPVVNLVPFFPEHLRDPVWILCRIEHIDEDEWNRMWGSTAEHPPENKQWIPVWTHQQMPPLHMASMPAESDTWDVIAILKSAEEYEPGLFRYEASRREAKFRMKSKEDMKLRLRERLAAMGNPNVVATPGRRGGSASFASRKG